MTLHNCITNLKRAFSFTKLSKYLYAQIKSDFGGPSSGNRLVYGRAGNAAEVNDSKSLVAAVRKLHVYDGEIKVLLVCRLVEDDNEEDRRV